ncbi:MAG: phosphoribosylanthranilate isomerase [Gammaproteobacteria bacterium]|nr:MAG: phosphoribosylanthranilate isomerase [Pseudomonadota bacterium]PIE38026.1 MAG: phosphoribosylanthranilate isomerase [Gammaproteobacteria bacterium]
MARTRIKLCGITRLEDALSGVRAGADALGFVFYKKSPRYITPEAVREIRDRLPAFVTVVGLFVNHSKAEIEQINNVAGLDLFQFHGDELPAFCQQFNKPFIKAVRVQDRWTVTRAMADYVAARGILADTYVHGVPGGTGEVFDWELLPKNCGDRLILAGGLNASNVAGAIRSVQPYAVDVSGGVEKDKGIKDKDAIIAFVKEVQGAKPVF